MDDEPPSESGALPRSVGSAAIQRVGKLHSNPLDLDEDLDEDQEARQDQESTLTTASGATD